MKQALNFLIRLSILNFLLFVLIVNVLPRSKAVNSDTIVNSKSIKTTKQITTTPTISSQASASSDSSAGEVPIPSEAPVSDTASQLSAHNSRSDCWISFEGSNYNLTSYFGSHPGGDSIMLKYCGQDATAAFNSKEKNPPIPHSGSARSMLAQFLVK